MKTLHFVRHAKSSWKYDFTDKDRPLKTRGSNDARLVAEKYNSYNIIPDRVFSSTAVRARETCNIFTNILKIPSSSVEFHDSLYDFGGSNVLRFIKEVDDSYNNVMLFGHNHAFTHLANALGSELIENLPTSGVVVMQFDIENWSDINKGQTLHTIFPRDLK